MAQDALTGESRGRPSGGDEIGDSLARQLSELARSLQAEPDLTELLTTITAAAVANIPGADHAGITLVADRGRSISTPVSTDPWVAHIDDIESRTGQGPCLDTLRDRLTLRVDDLAIERRWPLFTVEALLRGVRSLLCVQLFVRDRDLGVLNIYSTRSHAFTVDDETTGLLLAGHAAVALIGAEEQRHLRVAMDSRDIIGQAKGILMERYRIDSLRAFAILVRLSQDNNLRLIELADHIARTRRPPAGISATSTDPG